MIIFGGMDAMVARQLTDRLQAVWLKGLQQFSFATFGSGLAIGFLLVSTSLTWTLAWSDDRSMASAAVLMLATGFLIGSRWPRIKDFGQPELIVSAGMWSLLQPWVNTALATIVQHVPMALLASDEIRLLVGLICAAPCWGFMGWLFASLICHSESMRSNPVATGSVLSFGVATGIALCAFLAAPWIGGWSSIAALVAVVIVAWLANFRWPHHQSANSATVLLPPTGEAKATFRKLEDLRLAIAVMTLGGLLASMMRLASQLMPDTHQVISAEWIGLAVGLALGLRILNRSANDRTMLLLTLMPAATCGLALALFPTIVGISLVATCSLTSAYMLVAFRSLLLIFGLFPIGIGLASLGIIDCGEKLGVSTGIGRHGLPMAAGFIAAQFIFDQLSPPLVMSACSIALVLLSIIPEGFRPSFQGRSWAFNTGIVGCSLLGLSIPFSVSNYNPSRTSKLLFSTPTFVAYRIGWEYRLLPMLDDARVVDVREGTRGTLTLWRSHGLELHLRENGIPRSVVSSNTDVHPQFAPEVLQAVFPLVTARDPGALLILGASGGVQLSTSLQFPVRSVVCVENDPHLTDVIRGPIAQATGMDPFEDDRVTLLPIPPVMALMSLKETYDIVLSCPAPSSVVAGGPMFTVDHYKNASKRLAAGGVFCQRFQCVDYGPAPLRMVIQSMRQAFAEVIALETAAGEFLLLGANSKDVFVPTQIAERLESSHVRRLLARSGLDWSTLLNFPAYDHAALGEICSETGTWSNTSSNGFMALNAPLELMRWGPKLQEMQTALTAARSSKSPYAELEEPDPDEPPVQLSRKSRILEWMGEKHVPAELLRRLSEVATQFKVVQENPELHWWEYRKALRQQLQDRPRAGIQQARHTAGNQEIHPDDERRKQYFMALGAAAQKPNEKTIEAVEAHLSPYDPLISYFARQEIADLQARSNLAPHAELMYRLHVIYFAPGADASTRNIVTAIDLLTHNPDAISDPSVRFDTLNGLVQTLRSRWQLRQSYPVKSNRRQLADVDRSVVAIDKAVQTLETWHREAGLADSDWMIRKQVIDRLLIRPLHSYRSQLLANATRSESRADVSVGTDAAPELQN